MLLELVEDGEKVVQETRRWDDSKGTSYAMRSKEDAQDYRYFPDPDLTPILVEEAWIMRLKENQPEFRPAKLMRYKAEYDIPDYDAQIITKTKKMADIFEETTAICGKAKKVSNWLMVETMRLLKEKGKDPEDLSFSAENLAKLIDLADSGKINGAVAKEVFAKVFDEDIDPEAYVKEKGLESVNDEGAIRAEIEKIVDANPKSVEDFKAGKKKAMGFLVGQTMKVMKGKADPKVINEILAAILASK